MNAARWWTVALLLAIAAPSLAAGRWTVFIKPGDWADAIADPDTVWLASRDGGLWRYQRSSGAFTSTSRSPGGLASNKLTALERDRSGRLWIGTAGSGVSRLSKDGRTWTLLNAFDGLPSNTINCLEAQGDTVWIGTDGGLSLWNGREISGTVPDGVNPSPFTSNVIRGVEVLGDDVFVGTASGMYRSRLSQGLQTWTAINAGFPVLAIDGMASDGRDVFALVSTGTYRWSRLQSNWGAAGGNGNARRLRDDSGRICTVAPQGFYVWHPGPDVWDLAAGAPGSGSGTPGIVEPTVSSDSVIVAVDPAGVRLSNESYSPHTPPAPAGNDINNVVADGGTAYVGTQGQGFSRYRDGQWRSWTALDICPSCTSPTDTAFINAGYVLGLYQDADHVKWVGCWGASMSRMDDSGPTPVIWNRIINDVAGSRPVLHTYTWAGTTGPNNTRWFGLDTGSAGVEVPNGIDIYQNDGGYLRSYMPGYPGLQSGQVRALAFDRNGRLWVGYASSGISYSNVDPNFPSGDPLSLNTMGRTEELNIFGLKTVKNVLWVLATDGLRRLSITDDALPTDAPYSANAGSIAPRGAVHPLEVSADGAVWVGTSAGLRRYSAATDPSLRTFEDFNASNSPLPDNEVRSVAYDSTANALWIATVGGLARYELNYVAPPAPRAERLRVSAYPNPATLTGLGIALRLKTDATIERGSIIDLGGRVVRSFRPGAAEAVVWDGRDQKGSLVRPGVYFVRVTSGGVEGVARLVVVR